MQRIRLDFQRAEPLVPRLGVLILILAAATMIGIGYRYATLMEQVTDVEADADQLTNTLHRHGIAVRKGDAAGSAYSDEIERANVVLRRLSLPWDRLFDTIEAVAVKDVALLGLAPDADKGVVKIVIEAKDVAAALGYLRSLKDQATFKNVELQYHQIQLQDAERPIRFILQATWRALP